MTLASTGGHGRRAVGHRQAKRRFGRRRLNPAGTAFAWAGRAAGRTRQRLWVVPAIERRHRINGRATTLRSTTSSDRTVDCKSFKPKHNEEEEEEDRGEANG